MERIKIAAVFADSQQLSGQTVTVCGWAKTIRDMKTFGFIELNDGSCFRNLQVVMDANVLDNYKEIAAQNVGAALIVRGVVVLTPEAKQPLEVKASSITVEGASSPEYPLQKKRHSVEYLRTIAHLRPRTNLFSAAFRVRSVAAHAIHSFFQDRGFVYVHTPIITASDCEGAGEMFQVTTLDLDNPPRTQDGKIDYSQDFFGKRANLTVSGQLNAENFAMAFGDVYTFGPTFRAENSNTQRHAAEFWMIEPEMAFCDLKGDMEIAEAMIKHIIRTVMEKCPQEMAFFNSFVDKGLLERLEHVASSDFGRVTYTEAVEILKKNNDKFDYKVEWGSDLQTEHERYLTEQIFKRPVFVTDYPKEIKAFYMRLNDDGKTVAATDCLVPGIGEIIGGSQREERLDVLEARIKELGMCPEDYWWYCDLRRYGSCRHAGFGLGFERMVMYLTGVSNIRDVLPIREPLARQIFNLKKENCGFMKTPFVTKAQLEEITTRYPTPFHLYDETGMRRNARQLNRAFAWAPSFREYFAVKATPTPAILKILKEEGCGVDCSSLTELMLAEKCGFRGHEIMFTSNNTLAEEFQLAHRLGAVLNLDDITHVDFLEQSIGCIPETVFCRYNPGGVFTLGESKEGFQVMDTPGEAKYGMTRPQLTEAFRALQGKGAKYFGLHAFLASNTISNEYYPELAGILFRLAVELKEETGCHIRYINLSGGIGVPYLPEQEAIDIAAVGEGVRRKYEEILVPAGMGDVELCSELGRYMMGPYGCLVTRAIHEKHIYKEYIGVDACAADLMRPAVYGAYHHITVMGKENAPCDQIYDVTGALCENCDKFAVDRPLPKIDRGDLLVIHDTGAHGHCMGYNYNGKLRSAELLLKEDGGVEMIRRAETPEDYFATVVW